MPEQWRDRLAAARHLPLRNLQATLRKEQQFHELALLEFVAAGATWAKQRRFLANMVDSPTCPRCGGGPETDQHRAWGCPANDDIKHDDVKMTNYL